MRVETYRGAADDSGLVPAGHYFARLARNLEQTNAPARVRREEDARLEASYRRASASRANTFADTRALM